VMDNNNGYSEGGLVTLSTLPLQSDEPVNVNVTINGIGLPEDRGNWMPPNGQVIMFTVVPEFGIMVIAILAIAIMSIIVVSAKSRLHIISKL